MKTAPLFSLTAPAIGSGPLRRFYLPHSLGIFYAALTQFLGYRANSDEYKVMGLASYGRPAFAETFTRMVRFEQGRLRNDSSWFAFHLGSDNCYSHRFIDTFGPACPDEHHVDAEHVQESRGKRSEARCSEVCRRALFGDGRFPGEVFVAPAEDAIALRGIVSRAASR